MTPVTAGGAGRGAEEPREPLVERVAEELRTAILRGAIPPGERIRQDQVAKELGISKIPVREALQLLQAEGLIVLLPHAGARVPRLDANELIEIYEIRERLEPLAMRWSVPRLGDDVLPMLEADVARLEAAAAANDTGQWVEIDRRFHLLALSAAPPRLLRMIEPLWNVSQHYRRTYLVLPDRYAAAARDHELLLEAIESRNVDDAELICLMHIRRTRKVLVENRGLLGMHEPDTTAASGVERRDS